MTTAATKPYRPRIYYTATPDCIAATDGPAWSKLNADWRAINALVEGTDDPLPDEEAEREAIEDQIKEMLGGTVDEMQGWCDTYIMGTLHEIVGKDGRHVGWVDISPAEWEALEAASIEAEEALGREMDAREMLEAVV